MISGDPQIGIAIPTYRNIESLRRTLQSIALWVPELLERTTIVDDSGDGRVATGLRSEFPAVNWIVNEQNRGFSASANRAVLESTSEIIILLNDDVTLKSDFRAMILEWFTKPNLFAVTFQSVDQNGIFREGSKRLVWRMGIPRILHNPRDQRPVLNGMQHSDYAVGGHCAFRREAFLTLGGFDELFAPFYWEDVDISQRALRAGFEIVYCPECIVQHDGPSAIRSNHDKQQVRRIVWRNRLLFARRHASGLQKFLLPVAQGYLNLAATLRNDCVLIAAISEAKIRLLSYPIIHG